MKTIHTSAKTISNLFLLTRKHIKTYNCMNEVYINTLCPQEICMLSDEFEKKNNARPAEECA